MHIIILGFLIEISLSLQLKGELISIFPRDFQLRGFTPLSAGWFKDVSRPNLCTAGDAQSSDFRKRQLIYLIFDLK